MFDSGTHSNIWTKVCPFRISFLIFSYFFSSIYQTEMFQIIKPVIKSQTTQVNLNGVSFFSFFSSEGKKSESFLSVWKTDYLLNLLIGWATLGSNNSNQELEVTRIESFICCEVASYSFLTDLFWLGYIQRLLSMNWPFEDFEYATPKTFFCVFLRCLFLFVWVFRCR